MQGLCNGLAVATVSAPHHPPRIRLAAVPQDSSSSSSSCWDWQPVTALDVDLSGLPLAADALSNMRCEVMDVKPTVGADSLPMQAVVQVRLVCEGGGGAARWERGPTAPIEDTLVPLTRRYVVAGCR